MEITEIRVYAEVLEQGVDFTQYIQQAGFTGKIINIYTKKARGEFSGPDSIIDRIRKVKDVDVLITAVTRGEEHPLLMIEYSTAVPTDDHKMQRSDVYFWSANFKVPMMKISPSEKGMGQDFGGGSKITDEQEQRLAFDRRAIFYPIKWDTPQNEDVLPTKERALSCIPFSDEIKRTIETILVIFAREATYNAFYNALFSDYEQKYRDVLLRTPITVVRSSIVDSTRFHWYGAKLSVKINRFGHAMDPDRGVLYFTNMLVGAENTITEIQVNRPSDLACRGGYNALFDALARKAELTQYVIQIIRNAGNVFTDENALHVLTHGLNIENAISFVLVREHEYTIEDRVLRRFLTTHSGMAAKTIFFLSTELKLTDKDRNTICTIRWNVAPIREFLNSVNTTNRHITRIKPLTLEEAKEDIVTFASVELYKKLNYDLLAVSYPGAQGDRCILTGNGRNVLRTYIDIIAYKNGENGIQVFLEECKDQFSKSQDDVDKLNNVIHSPDSRAGLKVLFRKTIQRDHINDIFVSVAAKQTASIPRFLVDYIFMFNLTSDNDNTYIDYTVAIVNTTLVTEFAPLANHNRLAGRMRFDRIYIID